MKIYKYRKYNKKFPIIFAKEKEILNKIIPDARIEHIGSTSVKDLEGKGVIDIIIGVKKYNIKNIQKKLINNNYDYKKSGSKQDRLFFSKEKGFIKKNRFHIHLTTYKSTIWNQAIIFKKHLIENKKTRKEYSKLKKHALKLCKGNPKAYREYKNDYIKNIIRKAK